MTSVVHGAESEQILELSSRDTVVAAWKRVVANGGAGVSATTKKDAAAAILDHVSRKISRRGLQAAVQPFREFFNSPRDGLAFYRWNHQAVSIVRKAIGTVFIVGGVEPEEAIALWNVDIQQLRFAACVPSVAMGSPTSWSPRLYFNITDVSHFLGEIYAVLAVADAMEQAVRRADCDQAYKSVFCCKCTYYIFVAP